MPWHDVFERLTRHARTRPCVPPFPPVPLILAGWAYSNDVEKMQRWEETVAWARDNGCPEIIALDTTGLHGIIFDWRHYDGPLALLRLCRFVRIEILKDNARPRRGVPFPGAVIRQIGELILTGA